MCGESVDVVNDGSCVGDDDDDDDDDEEESGRATERRLAAQNPVGRKLPVTRSPRHKQ